jgi:BTB/POZ domain
MEALLSRCAVGGLAGEGEAAGDTGDSTSDLTLRFRLTTAGANEGDELTQDIFGAEANCHSVMVAARCASLRPLLDAQAQRGPNVRSTLLAFDIPAEDIIPDLAATDSHSQIERRDLLVAQSALVAAVLRVMRFVYTGKIDLGDFFAEGGTVRGRQAVDTRASAVVAQRLEISEELRDTLLGRKKRLRELNDVPLSPSSVVWDDLELFRMEEAESGGTLATSADRVLLRVTGHVGDDDADAGASFLAHRSVLSARSDFLGKMFDRNSPWQEATADVINLRAPLDSSPSAMLSALQFLYVNDLDAALAMVAEDEQRTRELSVVRSVVPDGQEEIRGDALGFQLVQLLDAATFLGIGDLIEACEGRLSEIALDVENVFAVWQFALARPVPLQDLAEACCEFAVQEFIVLCGRRAFEQASCSHAMMVSLLGPGHIDAPTDSVLAAVRMWRDAQKGKSHDLADDVEAQVDDLLPPSALFNRLNRQRLVSRASLVERLMW